MIVKVTTQAEMDKALRNPDAEVWLIGSGYFAVSDSASVRASGSASVRASGSASVRAWDSASVTAWDSASVRASGSASVRAWGSASVTAWDSASVRATPQVPVLVMGPRVKAKGGVQIVYKQPTTALEWLKNYGVEVIKGVAILYKGVSAEYKSGYGQLYTPGTKPTCEDWDGGVKECGEGFHFVPAPYMALKYFAEAVKFVACPVLVKEVAVHKDAEYPDKVKAPRVYGAIYEVDIDGKRV